MVKDVNSPKNRAAEAGARIQKQGEEAAKEQAFAAGVSYLRPYLEKAQPALEKMKEVLVKLQPYMVKVMVVYADIRVKLEPYHPEELVPAATGLVMCFFGSVFMTLIAAVEAFRQCGFEPIRMFFVELHTNYKKVAAEWEKDDEKDEDGDGIADVKQISPQKLAERKLRLVLDQVDPDKLTTAFAGFYAGIIAVLATLRIRAAQAVTLGNSIGNIVQQFVEGKFGDDIQAAAPKEVKRWTPSLIAYVCKFVGVSLAFSLHRVIQSFYSAIRGAEIFTQGILAYCTRNNLLAPGKDLKKGTPIYTGVTWAVALVGFYWQFSNGFALPFPMNLLLWPLTTADSLLAYVVSWM